MRQITPYTLLLSALQCRRHGRFLALLAALFVAACSTQPVSQPTPPQLKTVIQVPVVPGQIEQALTRLDALPNTSQTAYVLGWAQQYLNAGRVQDALTLLRLRRPESLTGDTRLRWVSLMSQIKLAQQKPNAAEKLLNSPTLHIDKLLTQAPLALRNRIALLRADTALLQGKLITSLQQRVSIDPLLNETTRQYNEQMIWTALMRLPKMQLKQALSSSQGDLLGWLQLADIYRDSQASIKTQADKVVRWQQNWPMHPASQRLPYAIQVLLDATHNRPQQVAILLPQKGKLSSAVSAIRDGLLTAYYGALSDSQQTPTLQFYDTSNGHIQQLYQQAVNAGADLVIGPLSKQRVAKLLALGHFPVPVITLNYSQPTGKPLPANFYEYGLAPEDELQQIANEAWHEGKTRAAVLYIDSAWGERMARAFVADWQALGGTLITTQPFSTHAEKVVPQLLLINESREREDTVDNYTPKKVHYNERPRQDIDFLLFVGDAKRGRQIKPLLNFHFASQLPVFALSYIYQGHPNPTRDRDLDGVRFTSIPWVLHDGPLHEKVSAFWPDSHGQNQSLFALGLDAYRLMDHLPLLIAAPDMYLTGHTGRLSLQGQRIVRELDWAKFEHGKAVPLPTIVSGWVQSPQ